MVSYSRYYPIPAILQIHLMRHLPLNNLLKQEKGGSHLKFESLRQGRRFPFLLLFECNLLVLAALNAYDNLEFFLQMLFL